MTTYDHPATPQASATVITTVPEAMWSVIGNCNICHAHIILSGNTDLGTISNWTHLDIANG